MTVFLPRCAGKPYEFYLALIKDHNEGLSTSAWRVMNSKGVQRGVLPSTQDLLEELTDLADSLGILLIPEPWIHKEEVRSLKLESKKDLVAVQANNNEGPGSGLLSGGETDNTSRGRRQPGGVLQEE
nr:uncharacterized protein LOC118680025 [Bactrocera oleae]